MAPRLNEKGYSIRWTAKGFLVQYRVTPKKWAYKRVPPDLKSERAAEAYFLAWKGKKEQEAAEQAAAEVLTVTQANEKWKTYSDNNPDISPATRRQRREIMTNWVLPDLGDKAMSPDEITPSILRRVIMSAKAQVSASRTLNIGSTLRVFFNDAIGERWWRGEANPMLHPHVESALPAARGRRRKIVYFTLDQFERLCSSQAVPSEWRIWYLLAGLTGLDAGELAGLTWQDVDTQGDLPSLKVERAFRLDWKVGKTKRESRVRVVPLHPEAVKALKAWRDGEAQKRLCRAPLPIDPVLPSPEGKHWRPKVAKILRGHLELAGLPSKHEGGPFTFKAFRRSFATWLEGADVPKDRRDRLMGHAAASVGEEHYAHAELSRLTEAVRRIKVDFSVGKLLQLPLKIAR